MHLEVELPHKNNILSTSNTPPRKVAVPKTVVMVVSACFCRILRFSAASFFECKYVWVWKLVMQVKDQCAHCNALPSMTSFSVVVVLPLSCVIRMRNFASA